MMTVARKKVLLVNQSKFEFSALNHVADLTDEGGLTALLRSVAPEKLRICENVVAPRIMNRIMPEIAVVPRSDFISASMVSTR